MLKPQDIQKKEFNIKLRGYAKEEVDEFLDTVIKDYDSVIEENKNLRSRVNVLTETVSRYEAMEASMQKSFDMAKSTAEEIKKNAETEARYITKKAELNAAEKEKQIGEELLSQQRRLNSMRLEANAFREKIKAQCASIQNIVEKL